MHPEPLAAVAQPQDQTDQDRRGCCQKGDPHRELPVLLVLRRSDHPEEVSLDRQSKLLLHQAKISKNRLKRWNGKRVEVIIEDIDSEKEILIGRGPADSPEIDGIIQIHPDREKVAQVEIGNFSLVEIIGNNEHDLIARIVNN